MTDFDLLMMIGEAEDQYIMAWLWRSSAERAPCF